MRSYFLRAITILCIIIFSASTGMCKVVYVNAERPDDTGDGLSWSTAKKTVCSGVKSAIADDEIWVAKGEYCESSTITLSVAAGLYGGFAGDETDRSQRNPKTNVTILDGKANSSSIIYIASKNASVVDGFTICNDNYTFNGAIYSYSAISTITNNIIENNSNNGIYNYNSTLDINHNSIRANSLNGIYVSSSATYKCYINNNLISGNIADGIKCSSGSPTIFNNKIWGNAGNGICCSQHNQSSIINNTIVNNSLDGIYCSPSAVVFTNNILAYNAIGFEISLSSTGTATFSHNCVYGNDTDYSGVTDPTGTSGNISADPGFVSTVYGNLHIQPDSPCIDAGDDSAINSDWTDIDNLARFQDGNGDGTASVDIGAYESDGAQYSSDPTIIHVAPEGSDENDGLSWISSKKTIQTAVNAISDVGGEVWVKAGIYPEVISLRPYSHLYGGFVGSETSKEQRNWESNETVIDNQDLSSSKNQVTIQSGRTPIYFDGFTVQHSMAYGIYCVQSSPILTNCRIISNAVGIGCAGASPEIVNNIIADCTGTGIICSYYLSSTLGESSPIVINNTIVNNGGGFSSSGAPSDSRPELYNNIFAFNELGISNAISTGDMPVMTIYNNCIYGNTTDYLGVDDQAGLNGNISADPVIADRYYGDYHIQPTSPCINAGSDDYVQTSQVDLDLEARIQGDRVDIGADESDGSLRPGIIPTIVRVIPDGNDENDGSSWDLAKKTIQAAIDDATEIGGEIWVKAGAYNENICIWPKVSLYGGFAGNETDKSQRNPKSNITIIYGAGLDNVVSVCSGYNTSSTIDGFTITGSGSSGHGIICKSAIDIINNIISGNYIGVCSGLGNIVGNSITNNQFCGISDFGGSIKKNDIFNNGSYGVYCMNGDSTVIGNTIRANVGGIYCGTYSPDSIIVNNLISANIGDGIRIEGGSGYCPTSEPTVSNNTISNNSSAGIYSTTSHANITNNIISFNAIGVYGTSGPTMTDNCIYGNAKCAYYGITDQTGVNGNISEDPLLVSSAYGDLHIQSGSPCIDAGDSSFVLDDQSDIDNQERIIGSKVDIGADEFDGTAWPEVDPVIVRVAPDGNDDNDGFSWALAKKTIQAAINAASSASGEVWVKAGTYNETITVKPYAYLYGGFAGNETDKSQRNWNTNVTIIDGQQQGNVVDIESGGFTSTVDGFTICGSSSSGCGVYCLSTLPIVNSTITGNYNGIRCGYSCYSLMQPTVSGNKIIGNSSSGIICYSEADVENNLISSNEGDGVVCDSYVQSTITGNTIKGNVNGIRCIAYTPIMAGNLIFDNSGNGIVANGPYTPIITNNTIANNVGKGVYCISAHPSISNNVLAYNAYGLSATSTYTTLYNNCFFGNTTANYSGITDKTGSNGNITADPLFINYSGCNYHLKFDSPCINAGLNTALKIPSFDIDLQARVNGAIDIGVDEYWSNISDAKKTADEQAISLSGYIVSAAFSGYFYIESEDRASGIRVEKADHGFSIGDRVDVAGTLLTNSDGEHYIAASTSTKIGTGSITPLALTNKWVGGGAFGYQNGVESLEYTADSSFTCSPAVGLNNIGLLVRTSGRVIKENTTSDSFCIDDGGKSVIKCIAPDDVSVDTDWDYISVSGICSCEKINIDGNDVFRAVIRLRVQDDISAIK